MDRKLEIRITNAINLLKKHGYKIIDPNEHVLRRHKSYKSILCDTFDLSCAQLARAAVKPKATSKQMFLIEGQYFTVSKTLPVSNLVIWNKYCNQSFASNKKIIWVAEVPPRMEKE
ncbi:MAG: hypothetical protein CK426_09265 [Legionella sp.]|nr:MAG: hypothetical protein CK426_09265 [Legionella sp.]